MARTFTLRRDNDEIRFLLDHSVTFVTLV